MTDFAARRRMMVDTQVRPSDVTKYPIIDAMMSVPRELFVPDDLREAAYLGENLDLETGDDRVILEPRTLAKMLDALNVQADEMVLDIGCGLGYSAAVLSRLAEAVIAVEADEGLAKEAQELLSDNGAFNAIVQTGPLADGAPDQGPYDAILLQGAAEELPEKIVDQLKDGGRIAVLFAEGPLGAARLGLKSGGGISWRFLFNANAPVLPGFGKERAFSL